MAKIGTWLIVIGGFVGLLGLTILPSALGSGSDKALLNMAVLTLSFAMMLIAGGLYAKARTMPVAEVESSASKRGRKASCDACGKSEPVIQCRVHHQHLCADCLMDHYDFRSCAYVPSIRRGKTRQASSYSHASGA
jgi:hypothetical protein